MIYYDLTESTYITLFKDMKFYFSSEKYMEKFENEVEDYVKLQCDLFLSKYRISIDKDYLENFFATALYRRIEKRGFYITSNKYHLEEDIFL